MEYSYSITALYDGELKHTARFDNAIDAVNEWNKCCDYGFANEVATYNFAEPNGKLHTKHFYRNGEVSGK